VACHLLSDAARDPAWACLGLAAKRFHVEASSIVAEIEALMPGSNCGQCGFAGCPRAAAAIADGSAPVTVCPPGGKALAQALAARLGISIDLDRRRR
jgi:electron transport complex protein RnfB